MGKSHEEQFALSFDWRRARQIKNLSELAELPGAGSDPMSPEFFNHFSPQPDDDKIEEALRRSLLYLVPEAIQTYVLGYFQACVLTCGAALERILKLEYRCGRGSLPKGKWTLGKCVYQLDWSQTPITESLLEQIKRFIGTRDSRAHALLEHEEPDLAIFGGKRGTELLGNRQYLLEPYRGEAKQGVSVLYSVLADLYAG